VVVERGPRFEKEVDAFCNENIRFSVKANNVNYLQSGTGLAMQWLTTMSPIAFDLFWNRRRQGQRKGLVLDQVIFGPLGLGVQRLLTPKALVRESAVNSVGEPDARNGHVRFDERGWETERVTRHRGYPRLL